MYLKSINIVGFKSFADKINVNFTDGLTVIVGPNGSGKSNICDAIRWVLGEQSTKTLRGSKMEDIIFNGTARRNGSGYAEVNLILNNESKIINTPYDEISVSRRYYRSGESEYYINNNQVRMRDVHELFMDTGLGRDGYSIIGQGRIAEILSLKTEDRRQVFDEASGITKFRYKKNEAQRKLAAADENLLRVNDIIMGLEERMEPLKAASSKATKYLELRSLLKESELSLWMDRLDGIKAEEIKHCANLKNAKIDLDIAIKRCDQIDREIEQHYETQREIDIKIEQEKEMVFETQNHITKNNGDLALIKTQIENNHTNITRLEMEIEYSKNDSNNIVKRIEEAKIELLTKEETLAAISGDLAKYLQEYDDISKRFLEKNEQSANINQRLKGATELLSDRKISISSQNALLLSKIETDGRLKEELNIKQNSVKGIKNELKIKENENNELVEEINGLENGINGLEKILAIRLSSDQSNKQTLEVKSRENYELKSRLAILNDMKRDFEGFSKSVKIVMKESGHGRLTGLYGPLSTLLKTKEEYSVSIEIALGGGVQSIVCENERSAKEAINLLKRQNAGRATFLPINKIKGNKIVPRGIEKYSEFIGMASDLLTYDKKFQNIVENILGRTVIATDLDSAIKMAREYNNTIKIVTLDGQVLNPGGSMVGGSVNRGTNLFLRSGEIEKIEKTLTVISEEVEKLTSNSSILAMQIAKIKFDLENLKVERLQKNNLLMKHNFQIESLKGNIIAREREIDEITKELNINSAEKGRLIVEIASATEDVKAIQLEIAAIEEQLLQEDSGRAEFIQKSDELKTFIWNQKIEINRVEKDIEVINNAILQYENQSNLSEKSLGIKMSEIARLKKEIDDYSNSIITVTNLNTILKDNLNKRREQIDYILQQKMQLEGEIIKKNKQIKEERIRQANLERESIRLENLISSAVGERDSIIEKMWDNYEVTLTEAGNFKKEITNKSELSSTVSTLRNQIRALGNVNMDSIDEYLEVKEKLEFLTKQRDDLLEAKGGIEKVISELTKNMCTVFEEQFEIINKHFAITFRKLFGGGSGELLLTDATDILESGIEIKVQPPGKKVKSLSLLSGGEQAFVAIALVFAILEVKPTPFCVFDEIEAALDDVNVLKFVHYLKKTSSATQFIIVTHRRGTMEAADMLYGVTMQEQGVSKLLSINVSEVEKRLNLKLS